MSCQLTQVEFCHAGPLSVRLAMSHAMVPVVDSRPLTTKRFTGWSIRRLDWTREMNKMKCIKQPEQLTHATQSPLSFACETKYQNVSRKLGWKVPYHSRVAARVGNITSQRIVSVRSQCASRPAFETSRRQRVASHSPFCSIFGFLSFQYELK